MHFARLLCVMAFGLLATACGSPAKDLSNVCALVTEVQAEKGKSQKEKTVKIMKNIRDAISTSEVKDLIKTVSNKPKKKRYKALLKAAKKMGVENYTCKPAKKWLESA